MNDLTAYIKLLQIIISAIIGSLATIYIFWWNAKYKKSETYLNEVKYYFNNALNLITEQDHHNIKWHNTMHSLKSALEISTFISAKEHQKIFIKQQEDTVYKIGCIIDKIDSPKFFYGRPDYRDLDDTDLLKKPPCETWRLNETHPAPDLSYLKHDAISIGKLSFLCRFLNR